MKELRDLCGPDRLHFELTRELLSITRQQRNSARRAGLNKRLAQALKRHFYDDHDDAVGRAQRMVAERKALAERGQQAVQDPRGEFTPRTDQRAAAGLSTPVSPPGHAAP
jgi:DNA sulfur modification protein DndC